MKQYNEYKDSGVKWIGEIPSHWKAVQLRRITTTVRTGTTPSGVSEIYFNKTGLCWFTPSDFENNYVLLDSEKHLSALGEKKVKIFPKNSILMIGIGGTMGKVALAKVQCASNQQINAIIPNNNVNPMFLVYYLKCMQDNIFKTARFTTLPILNQLETKKIPIPIPPLFEQQAIASYLDTKVAKIDSFIATAEKKIAALDELKQVTIADAVTHGINPDVPMKNSGIPWIGMVPEHWEVNKIRSLFKLSNQKTNDPNCTLLSLSQYTGVRQKSECANVGMFEAETTIGYNIVQKGQFIMNIMLAWNGSYSVSNYNGVISPAYCVFDFIRNCNKKYFDYLLRLKAYSSAFKTLSKGLIDSRLRLYPDYFKTFPIVFPPVEEQNEIVAYIDRKVAQIDKMKAAELAQIDKLKEYKQRLISDVVTGKVKVTNE